MEKRFMCIWFRHLITDWQTIRQPRLLNQPIVFAASEHNKQVVCAANPTAEAQGIYIGMTIADAKAFVSDLQVFDSKPERAGNLLRGIGEWCIRYTPTVVIDLPNGLIFEISGCTHLWNGERAYLKEVLNTLHSKGYDVRAAIADTIGTAWAVARYGKVSPIIESGNEVNTLLPLPATALRLEQRVVNQLRKLGLRQISSFIDMPQSVLRRRFGEGLTLRLKQAIGQEDETFTPIKPIEPYQERLPCLEPIRTAPGIEIAIQKLLEALCLQLKKDGKGVRTAKLSCYRIDGKVEIVDIGTSRPTYHIAHLLKLFALKIPLIEPALGIELFLLEVQKFEEADHIQEALWASKPGLHDGSVGELLDRVVNKLGNNVIHRYLPAEHSWPERSIVAVRSLTDKPTTNWRNDKPRPVRLLVNPERVEVSAPIPDYPPMLFVYKGIVHHIKKADGPERIEREWWLDGGEHRDYYNAEDQDGKRYWLFRLGHYTGEQSHQWFIHGFFA